MRHSTSYAAHDIRLNLRPESPIDTADEPAIMPPSTGIAGHQLENEARHADAVGYILDDCFFSIGQAVGSRKSVDQAAVIWWRDRYHRKFLRRLTFFGNRWLQDRSRVIATVRMLGDRAVYYAGNHPSITIEAAMKASADVERYCMLHAERRRRQPAPGDAPRIYAGYYCTA